MQAFDWSVLSVPNFGHMLYSMCQRLGEGPRKETDWSDRCEYSSVMCLPLLLSRQTMVVTTEYCEVLYVEADHMRRIYEVTLRYNVLHSPILLLM